MFGGALIIRHSEGNNPFTNFFRAVGYSSYYLVAK